MPSESSAPDAEQPPVGPPAGQGPRPGGTDPREAASDRPLTKTEKKLAQAQAKLGRERAKAQAKQDEKAAKEQAKQAAEDEKRAAKEAAEREKEAAAQAAADEKRAAKEAKESAAQAKVQAKRDEKAAKEQAKQAAEDEKRAAKEAAEREKEAAAQAAADEKRAAKEAKESAAQAKVQAKRDEKAAKEQAKQAAEDEKRAAKEAAEREKEAAAQAAADEKRAAKEAKESAAQAKVQAKRDEKAAKEQAKQAAADEKRAAKEEKEVAAQAKQSTKRAKPEHRATRQDKRAAKKAASEAKQAEKAQKRAAAKAEKPDKAQERAATEADKPKKAKKADRARKKPPAKKKAPRQERAEARAFAKRRRGAEVGIEVDGQIVRVVEVDDGEIIWTQTFGRDISARDSIQQWLDDRPGKRRHWSAPTVSWAGPGTHLRLIEVPEGAEDLRPLLIGLVKDDLPLRPGSYQLAAVEEHSTLVEESLDIGDFRALFQTMSVTAIDQQPLGELWQVLHDCDAGLIPAEYTLGADGLALAVRNSKTTVVLCRGGVPVAARDLPAGGLDAFTDQLSSLAAGDLSRVEAILRGERPSPAPDDAAAPDPWSSSDAEPFDWDGVAEQAEPDDALISTADAFVSEIASEVRASVGYWQHQGLSVPSDMVVLGPGAQLLGLSDQLDLVGLRAVEAELPEGADWGETPAAGELAYHGAATAAVSDADLAIEIQNPIKQQQLARERALRVRSRRVALAGAVIVAAAWFLMRPYLDARTELEDVSDQREQLASTVSRVAGVEDRVRQLSAASASVLALTAAEPDWVSAFDALRGVAPTESEFLSMELGLRPCRAEPGSEVSADQAAAEEGSDANAAPASIDHSACIGAHMTLMLPKVDTSPQRLASVAAWVARLEALGGAEVWPTVGELDLGGEEAADGGSVDEAPESETSLDDAEIALSAEPGSLANTSTLAVVVDLLLPNSAPYRTPRDAEVAAGGQDNG